MNIQWKYTYHCEDCNYRCNGEWNATSEKDAQLARQFVCHSCYRKIQTISTAMWATLDSNEMGFTHYCKRKA